MYLQINYCTYTTALHKQNLPTATVVMVFHLIFGSSPWQWTYFLLVLIPFKMVCGLSNNASPSNRKKLSYQQLGILAVCIWLPPPCSPKCGHISSPIPADGILPLDLRISSAHRQVAHLLLAHCHMHVVGIPLKDAMICMMLLKYAKHIANHQK